MGHYKDVHGIDLQDPDCIHSNRWPCIYCTSSFKTNQILLEHLAAFHQVLEHWTCVFCSGVFLERQDFATHMAEHLVMKTHNHRRSYDAWNCFLCDFFSQDPNEILNHMNENHLKEPVTLELKTCPRCRITDYWMMILTICNGYVMRARSGFDRASGERWRRGERVAMFCVWFTPEREPQTPYISYTCTLRKNGRVRCAKRWWCPASTIWSTYCDQPMSPTVMLWLPDLTLALYQPAPQEQTASYKGLATAVERIYSVCRSRCCGCWLLMVCVTVESFCDHRDEVVTWLSHGKQLHCRIRGGKEWTVLNISGYNGLMLF